MAKNLENGKKNDSGIEEVPMGGSEVDFDESEEFANPKFDSEGNMIDPPDEDQEDDEQDETDLEPEPEAEEVEEEELEPEVSAKKPNKKLTNAEIKVINQKKELQRLTTENKRLEDQLQAKQTKDKTEDLKSQFVEQGFDEDTATTMAASELRILKLEERTAVAEFKEENASLFNKYPDAKGNAVDIMKKSKSSGLSPEQVCIALYSKQRIPSEERAATAAKGLPTREVDTKTTTSSRNSESDGAALTQAQMKDKKTMERMFNDGQEIPIKEYIEHLKRLKG